MDKHLMNYNGSKKLFIIIGILTVGQGISIVFQAKFLSSAITNLFKGAASFAVLPSLIGFGGFFFLRYFLQWLKERLGYRFAERTSFQFQSLLVERLFAIGPGKIGKNGSGSTITLCLEGISNFRTYLELFIPRAVSMVCIPLILLIYIFKLDILSGVVLIVTMPIMVAFLILLGLLAQKKIDAQMGTYQELSSHFVDSLRGIVTLKFLGRSKSHINAIETVSEKYRIATLRTLRLAFLSTFALDFFSSLSVAVVAVELGLRLIEGNIQLEAALLILILAPEYYLPIRSFGNDYHATMDGKVAGKQIHDLLDEDHLMEEPVGPPLPEWDEEECLSIQNLSKDLGDRRILSEINLQVKGYQKVGIIGPSGSGKTTLIELLSGLSEANEGTITYNSQEIDGFSVAGWQNQVTYIPQHPYIFSGTVAENICWYAPDSSKEEIWSAVKHAGLIELVDSLPAGIDEKIGQGGRSLSGGEEQRIALARSLLQQRPIMLFDEPTAHLDIETEHDLKLLLLPLMKKKLVFFATHRLHWMKEMDLILMLENGCIVEIGTHDELYQRRKSYYQFVNGLRGEVEHEALSSLC